MSEEEKLMTGRIRPRYASQGAQPSCKVAAYTTQCRRRCNSPEATQA